ncbi:RagB/SusD family nutrient uptake outer membrane protein [Neolewinella antarctica]|uniref:RagB/SusD family nutrient uptake outer membrane protein n=1 Tax=Neolewinella antarctica TaxID=442734 RepID=A0ABX0X7Y0_9BACT|nr:RagB/SusD family nutrient uptake outer membrane protein [Neolewinella antarctica]NJC25344.1 hypothetical protein [Neolewinella antarctica]
MKTFFNIIFLGVATCILLPSCSDEFLEQTPEQSLSVDNAVVDLISLTAAVNGVYSNMQDANVYGWDLPLIPDLRADNVYVSQQNAGRFIDFGDFELTDQSGRPEDEWTDMYEIIVNTSNIINRVPAATFLPREQEGADQLLGESYALRGLTYWNLLRMFAPPYTNNGGDSPGVPITNEGTTGEIIAPSRESVAVGYQQVISDLITGIDLMTTNDDGRLGKSAAQGFLAKVYLYQEDWVNAETQATFVISDDKYSLYPDSSAWFGSYGSNFGTEDLFALQNLPADNFGVNSIGGIMDQNGYGDILGTQDLYDVYSTSDYRRSAMVFGDRVDGESGVYFLSPKYPKGELGEDYIKILRLSDVYLIRAEARAETGNEDGAREDLNDVASRRDIEYEDSADSGDDLIEAIILERRKELAFEGDRVFDLMRHKRTWTKFRSFEDEVISWDNDQLINPIPRAEINVNPNITQNPGY